MELNDSAMIVIFSEPAQLKYPFYYNEHKVSAQLAKLLYAGNYILDAPDLSLQDKLHRFHLLRQLNNRTIRNTLHAVLGFHPSEQLTTQNLVRIAVGFMNKIGFGRQPFLVYQHFDAAHPHLHIISTNITPEGLRIDMNRLYLRKGREACRELEREHGLHRITTAQEVAVNYQYPQTDTPQTTEYGKSPTAQYIAQILEHVFRKFTFTSVPELNAILRLFRCKAESGRPGSILNKKSGIIYRRVDKDGRNIGAHIDAHSLPSNPGLSFLQSQFLQHAKTREKQQDGLRSRIDYILRSRPPDWPSLTRKLRSESIHLFPYAGLDKKIYGLCFVDLRSPMAIAGGSLGAHYTAAAIFSQIDGTIPTHALSSSLETTLGPNHDINRALKLLVPLPPAPSTHSPRQRRHLRL